ncbi:MAG: ABC transporter permease, partial [Fervidicoccaceae archaeon]|nr:ABC transporter permease [Fervidicoccaceae archaeon]
MRGTSEPPKGNTLPLGRGGGQRSFIAPGVVFQSATFISLAYGIMMVFERESGILKRLLSTPIPRSSIVIGRALAGSIRASTQYILVILSAFLVGAHF